MHDKITKKSKRKTKWVTNNMTKIGLKVHIIFQHNKVYHQNFEQNWKSKDWEAKTWN
jgi:hypothetical protein